MFGQRKVVVRDSYPVQPPSSLPLTSSSSYAATSTLSSPLPADCYTALSALSDCESRHGFGSDKCRFFRLSAEQCQAQQAVYQQSQHTTQ